MDSNLRYFQADSEGVVWTEDVWPMINGRESDCREFCRRDGLNVLVHLPSGACELDLNRQFLDKDRSPSFWFKETPEGVSALVREQMRECDFLLPVPREDLRGKLVGFLDQKYPFGTVVADGMFYEV